MILKGLYANLLHGFQFTKIKKKILLESYEDIINIQSKI